MNKKKRKQLRNSRWTGFNSPSGCDIRTKVECTTTIAQQKDEGLLLQWANDPQVRANSLRRMKSNQQITIDG